MKLLPKKVHFLWAAGRGVGTVCGGARLLARTTDIIHAIFKVRYQLWQMCQKFVPYLCIYSFNSHLTIWLDISCKSLWRFIIPFWAVNTSVNSFRAVLPHQHCIRWMSFQAPGPLDNVNSTAAVSRMILQQVWCWKRGWGGVVKSVDFSCPMPRYIYLAQAIVELLYSNWCIKRLAMWISWWFRYIAAKTPWRCREEGESKRRRKTGIKSRGNTCRKNASAEVAGRIWFAGSSRDFWCVYFTVSWFNSYL